MTLILILTGFYVLWLASLLKVAYTPSLFQNYTLFKAINSILFVIINFVASFHHRYLDLLAAADRVLHGCLR